MKEGFSSLVSLGQWSVVAGRVVRVEWEEFGKVENASVRRAQARARDLKGEFHAWQLITIRSVSRNHG